MTNFEIQTVIGERYVIEAESVDWDDQFVVFSDEKREFVAGLPTRQLSFINRAQVEK